MPNVMARELNHLAAPVERPCEAMLSLVNPSTGLANDYLNVFNEILLLLEFLPSMPEMTDDALAWQPRGYCEYFEKSSVPGADHALRAYDQIDPNVRANFESILARLTEIAVEAQRTLAEESRRPDYPDSIAKSCEETAEAMRIGLAYASRLINDGRRPASRPARRPDERLARRATEAKKNGC